MYHSLPIHVSIYSTFVAENFKRHCSFMALYGKKFFETHLRKKGGGRKRGAYNTKHSQVVTHLSTNLAQCCLTSVI